MPTVHHLPKSHTPMISRADAQFKYLKKILVVMLSAAKHPENNLFNIHWILHPDKQRRDEE